MVDITVPCPHCGLLVDLSVKHPFVLRQSVMTLLHVGKSVIHNWTKHGGFPEPVTRCGNKALLDRKDVLKWLRKHHSPEAAAKMDQVLP